MDKPMVLIRDGFNLLNEIDKPNKIKGVQILSNILKKGNSKNLIELGYDKLIFKELVKHSQFEEDCLEDFLELLESHYFKSKELHDELAELLLYRAARSTKAHISQICLKKLLSLIELFDESVAKHSKQILNLADLNTDVDNNLYLLDILTKLETKLPKRKKIVDFNDRLINNTQDSLINVENQPILLQKNN